MRCPPSHRGYLTPVRAPDELLELGTLPASKGRETAPKVESRLMSTALLDAVFQSDT